MQVTRIYSGDDGQSHFEDMEVALEDLGARGHLSAPWPASAVLFREVAGDYALDFHTAPRRQLVVNLTGSVDIEVGDGKVRRLWRRESSAPRQISARCMRVSRVTGSDRFV